MLSFGIPRLEETSSELFLKPFVIALDFSEQEIGTSILKFKRDF